MLAAHGNCVAPAVGDDEDRTVLRKILGFLEYSHRRLKHCAAAAANLYSAGDGLRTVASNIEGADDHSTVPGS